MARRRAAPKTNPAPAAVKGDTESDSEDNKGFASGSGSSFDGSSASEEEIEVKEPRKAATAVKKYGFNHSEDSNSSGDSSSEENDASSKLKTKRLRLVRPAKRSSESSSDNEEESDDESGRQQQRTKTKPLVDREPIKKVRFSQDLSSSSSDDESEGGESRRNIPRVGSNRHTKAVSTNNDIDLAGSSSSSSEEDSELEEKKSPKKTPVGRKRKPVASRNNKGSSSFSSSVDDSKLEQSFPRRKKSTTVQSGEVAKGLGRMKETEDMRSSSSSSSEDDSKLKRGRLQEKKTILATNSISQKNVIGFDDSSSGSSSSEDNVELEAKRLQQKRSLGKHRENAHSDSSSSSSSNENLEEKLVHQIPSSLKSGGKGRHANDAIDLDDLSSSSSGEDNEENTNEPLNIQPKVYDIESESGSSKGGSASDTDSEVGWQPQDAETKEDEQTGEDIVEDSNKGSETEWEEDEMHDGGEFGEDLVEDDGNFSDGDVRQAKYVMRNITSYVPLLEETAICRGVIPTGPPLEFATTHLDEYARKFRWPQHVRNLRNRDFSQDPSEILEDYEVIHEPGTGDQDTRKESAFAQVPRPIVSLAADSLRRSSRKRKRASDHGNQEQASEEIPSASKLLNIARIGGRFGDEFVESLMSANGKALQGIDCGFDYDKRCWSSLPTRKKPVANWRFVLEHVRRTMCKSESFDGATYPPLKKETLERITKRLQGLYGKTTQHEEFDVFKSAATTSNNSVGESEN